MAEPYERVVMPGAGRVLLFHRGRLDRVTIRPVREKYGVVLDGGVAQYTLAQLGTLLADEGRPMPTDDDFAWLRGKVARD